jgi:FtsH-binding integral membrane protein
MWWIALLIASLVSMGATYISAYPDMQAVPTCNEYVKNTYLYLMTYVIIMCFMVLALAAYKLPINIRKQFESNLVLVIATFIVYILLYIGTFMAILLVNKKHLLLKHFLALFFIFLSALFYQFLLIEFGGQEMLIALGITVVVFVALSIIAFKFQDLLTSRVSMAFLIMFIVVVVVELLVSLIAPFSWFARLITLVVMMFIVYIAMVHTKRMIENAKDCEKDGGPDYVREAMSFFVDMKNIFIRVLSLRR